MLDLFELAALEAGKVILSVYGENPKASYKADSSPVTEADERAEQIILDILSKAYPNLPAIAEEAVARGHVPDIAGGPFILIDPLDGTKEFIAQRREFTVNIALIEGGVPVAGIVYAPALSVAYRGDRRGACRLKVGSDFHIEERSTISARTAPPAAVALASRSHRTAETDKFLETCGAAEICSIGSSLKFCLLAEGKADIYPRFGRTMEWDTAAGDAVLRAAGGETLMLDGQPLTYGKTGQEHDSDFSNPHFIAWGERRHDSNSTRKTT